MVSLNGTTVNLTITSNSHKAEVIRKKKAGSGRHTTHKVGPNNKSWSGTGWFNSLSELQFLEGLVSLGNITFIDKHNRSYTITITEFEYDENTWAHTGYSISFEEAE